MFAYMYPKFWTVPRLYVHIRLSLVTWSLRECSVHERAACAARRCFFLSSSECLRFCGP